MNNRELIGQLVSKVLVHQWLERESAELEAIEIKTTSAKVQQENVWLLKYPPGFNVLSVSALVFFTYH